jgi:hypothetical protein
MGRGERVVETAYVREGHALASQGNDASSPLTSHGRFSGSTCLLCDSLPTNLRVFPDERAAQIRHTVLRREATAIGLVSGMNIKEKQPMTEFDPVNYK